MLVTVTRLISQMMLLIRKVSMNTLIRVLDLESIYVPLRAECNIIARVV